MRASSALLLSSLVVSLVACGGSPNGSSEDDASADGASQIGTGPDGSSSSSDDAATNDTGASAPDSTAPVDAGSSPDASIAADSSSESDSNAPSDATSSSDAGSESDSSSPIDASLPIDSSLPVDSSSPIDSSSLADSGAEFDAADAEPSDAGSDASDQQLVTTLGPDAGPIAVTINQGTAIGGGKSTGGTPATLTNLKGDPNNTETIVSSTDPFSSTGNVPDRAAGFCEYPDSGAPKRVSYITGASFEGDAGTDLMVPMAPFYFPLVYTSTVTATGNAVGGDAPIIGLFDWRPKDIDEALVAAESDDNGLTWYFMQTVLELNPDYTDKNSGGYATSTSTGCPATIEDTNAKTASVSGSQADDGWGHATIIQLPGEGNADTGQVLYLLDRNTNALPDGGGSIVDNAPLHVIKLGHTTTKFPVWNTNKTNDDIKSITSALSNTPDSGAPVVVEDSVGLLNPDGIMAVFPTAPGAAAGSLVTVLYVQKIVNGDEAIAGFPQCTDAPVSGKINHDISNVRLATTRDGVTFSDLGIVSGLNDPTTVDYNQTRWISPRGTLIDINGDGSRWGLYFSGGNCLDGDSDAFHFIGYAESSDMRSWTVYNDINSPIASINTITVANAQAGGATVTIPANPPVFPTQPWFAERLYAPTATRIDSMHLSMTFAGYGVQTPSVDLLNYRQIGNVVLTVSKALPAGVPNNINAHE